MLKGLQFHAVLTSDILLQKPFSKKSGHVNTKKQTLPVLNHFYFFDTICFNLNCVVVA